MFERIGLRAFNKAMRPLSPVRRPMGSGGIFRCLSAVLLLVSVASLRPGTAGAQTLPPYPRLSFRDELDLQVLGSVTKDFTHAPSFRITFRRRSTLRRSTIVSGMLLLDPLSNSVGVAVGQMLTFETGSKLLEPFAEVGVASSDARVSHGSYKVAGAGGTGSQVVEQYQAVRGLAALAGAGVSWSGTIFGHRRPVRVTLGYWQLAGGGGFRYGSVRVGVSLGWAHRDPRWYALASDRTPPRVLIVGQDVARLDSIDVTDGRVRILAADANGIAGIRLNGVRVAFRPADAASVHKFGLGSNAVVVTVKLAAPFDGRKLEVAVQDRAGLTTRRTVWVFAARAHTPPPGGDR